MVRKVLDSADDAEDEISNGRKAKRVSDGDLEKLYDESSSRILQERNDFFLPQIRDFGLHPVPKTPS
jgi:hypothetical protein